MPPPGVTALRLPTSLAIHAGIGMQSKFATDLGDLFKFKTSWYSHQLQLEVQVGRVDCVCAMPCSSFFPTNISQTLDAVTMWVHPQRIDSCHFHAPTDSRSIPHRQKAHTQFDHQWTVSSTRPGMHHVSFMFHASLSPGLLAWDVLTSACPAFKLCSMLIPFLNLPSTTDPGSFTGNAEGHHFLGESCRGALVLQHATSRQPAGMFH